MFGRKKGNINYKYIRRRKSWLRRNIGLVIFIAVISLLIIAGLTVGVILLRNNFAKKDAASQATEAATEETTSKAATWYEYTEKTTSAEVSYTAPTNAQYPYYIKINRSLNCVTVYGIDANGEYKTAIKSFICSCGATGTETQLGEFSLSYKMEWGYMGDGYTGQYASVLSNGYALEAVPSKSAAAGNIVADEFNKLGTAATIGYVRLTTKDAKWIYDNCAVGTKIMVYEDASNPGELGKPEMIKLVTSNANSVWDPTDPNTQNPWLTAKPSITGTKDITVSKGNEVNLLTDIKAYDTCGNDISSSVQLIGKYTFDIAGTYTIKYLVIDALGNKAETSIKLIVTE